MHKGFYHSVRASLFGGDLKQSQVSGMEIIEGAWKRYGDGDVRKLAYVLATAFHETAFTMQPIKEYGSQAYLRSKDYYPYFGRGYVQLTWERNFADWSGRLGLNLVKQPDLALDPDIASRILVQGMMLGTFTGKELSDYINGDACDFTNARRIVNGTDKAKTISGHAYKFLTALQTHPMAVEPPHIPAPATEPPKPAPAAPRPTSGRAGAIVFGLIFLAALAAFIFRAVAE